MSSIRSGPQKACAICGSDGKPLYDRLKDQFLGSEGEWGFSRCENTSCGLTWLDPMPFEEDISKAYLDYYTHIDSDSNRSLASRLLFSVLGLDSARKRAEACYLGDRLPGHVLEIGFGDGKRLERLRTLGWKVEGQEVDPVAVKNARDRGFKVHEGRLQELNFPDGKYDAVIGNHVIEHVHAPLEMLKTCRRITRPGGEVILVTPNVSGYGHRVFGQHWLGLDPPRHLHLLTCSSMELLINKAGFSQFELFTVPALSAIPFQASIAMARTGGFRYSQKASGAEQVSIAWHVTASRFWTLLKRQRGEEVVCVAIA